MPVFRNKYLRTLLTLMTGIIFLNMGFFLLEVRLLDLHKNRQLMENISRMVAGAAFEEERDAGSSSAGFAEEEYVAGHHAHNHQAKLFLISDNTSHLFEAGTCRLGYLKKFSPPPER